MSAAFTLLCVVLGEVHATYSASLHTEVRARSAIPTDVSTTAAGDLELGPTLQGGLESGALHVSLSYAPIVWLRELYLRPRYDGSHRVHLLIEARRAGYVRPFAFEYFTDGLLDLATFALPAPGSPFVSVEPLPQLGNVHERVSDSVVGLEFPLSAVSSLTTSAGLMVGGGADPMSQTVLPFQFAPHAELRAQLAASRVDTFVTTAEARRAWFSNGNIITVIEARQAYQKLYDAQSSFELSAGAAWARNNARGSILPHVGASGAYRFVWDGPQLAVNGNLQAAPFVDRFSGAVYERVELNVALLWTLPGRWSTSLRGGAAQSLATRPLVFTAYEEANLSYQAERDIWRFDLTGRHALTVLDSSVGSLVSQWVIGVALTLTAQGGTT